MEYKYAGVVVNNDSIMVDKIFTYQVPEKLLGKVKLGQRVKIPFGKGDKLIDGFIMELKEELKEEMKYIKPIRTLCDESPLFDEEGIALIEQMKRRYLATYIDCIRLLIPTGLIKGMTNKTERVLYAKEMPAGKFDKSPYIEIYNAVKAENGLYTRTTLSNKFSFSLSSINTMLKHHMLSLEEVIVDRLDDREYGKYTAKTLNAEQIKAVETIMNSDKGKYLIHGVTGSGKTEIYLNLVENMLKEGKDSIVLVPEISLTPQMIERFKGRFGSDISVYHSKMSDGERFDEWMRIKNKRTKIAIGARSALFLPFSNLGLIIIDEEHENSYKSESNPKYDAREIAEFIAMQKGSKLVLGTATPSMDTYYRAKAGELELIEIKNRVDNAKLPNMVLADMREELAKNNRSIFSSKLYTSIEKALGRGEQIILFLNRRGFSTFVSCRKCGFVYKCKQCDITLTYHKEDNLMHCHYCGYRQPVHNQCPECSSKYIKYFGIGTERVEEEVKRYFPSAKTLRMDMDTTRKKNSYINIYESFKKGEAQILIGTQMIAKGLDFPNVTLVGVLAADLTLNLPDYKSAERTFQLLTQVAGRAGRSNKQGEVIIQTYTPDHYSIQYSLGNDYTSFYNREIGIRNNMNYPPFTELININLSSSKVDLLITTIKNLGIAINSYLEDKNNISILGPCPCAISKIKDMHRWQIILKGHFDHLTAAKIKDIVYDSLKNVYTEVRLNLDVNPNNLI
ncbi:primosomal protein N' [Clostridium thermarum]|uniref:primosomal protein N' n=1 Tax=Clostridium thermarum TaxID=1716543 RepID=UPI001122CC8B|nr:primosomal protein N' [Clostridium thermarum]